MTRRLILTRAASDDLIQIEAWLGQPGAGIHARRRLARLATTLNDLVTRPRRGRCIENGPRRAVVSDHYRIVYVLVETPQDETVLVIRIFGPGQNF